MSKTSVEQFKWTKSFRSKVTFSKKKNVAIVDVLGGIAIQLLTFFYDSQWSGIDHLLTTLAVIVFYSSYSLFFNQDA